MRRQSIFQRYDFSPASIVQTIFMLCLGLILYFYLDSTTYRKIAKRSKSSTADQCLNSEPHEISETSVEILFGRIGAIQGLVKWGFLFSSFYCTIISIRNGSRTEIALAFALNAIIAGVVLQSVLLVQ
jgi:hypothetical protein